nr:hypothetical protein [Tanacetum cinerariifolium]
IIIENVPHPNNNPNVPEEEPIPEQAAAALVRFSPQWIDEVNEDDDGDPEGGDGEEEEMEIDKEVHNPKFIDPDEPPPPVF